MAEKGSIPAEISVRNGIITQIQPLKPLISIFTLHLPGFIDSHVHIESSMLEPSEFARLAVVHGTVGTISDPHEIAMAAYAVHGRVEYMIENGKRSLLNFIWCPSCVPKPLSFKQPAT